MKEISYLRGTFYSKMSGEELARIINDNFPYELSLKITNRLKRKKSGNLKKILREHVTTTDLNFLNQGA